MLVSTFALMLAACSQEPAAPTATETSVADPIASSTSEPAVAETPEVDAAADPRALSPEGLEDIVVGKAPPARLKGDDVQLSESCQTYSDKPRSLYVMTDGKVVARITAMKGSPVKTAKGIAVGASEAAVRKAYPDARAEPHKYSEAPAKYLDWRPGDGTRGLRFEIDGEGRVAMIHAGREPELEYVEGCA